MKGSERMVFKEVEKHDLPDIQSAGYLYEHEGQALKCCI